MFKYQKLVNIVKKLSEEKVKNVLIGQWYGNTLFVLAIYLVLSDFCTILFYKLSIGLWFFSSVLLFIVCLYYLATRRVGIATTENRLVFVLFKHLKSEEKRIFEVPTNKIKSITVSKIFTNIYLKISFISDEGRLEKKKIIFSTYYIGLGATEYKENSKKIYDELVKIQKVIDKGDF